jgi:ABC-2 type transport system ATP-binding protein
MMLALESRALSKTYRSGILKRSSLTALEDFSLSVESGEIFSLLGPNGAGKTTFIKIVLSLVRSSAGSLTVLGEEIPSVRVRKRVGYLPENLRYPGYLTGDQVMTYFGRLAKVHSHELRSRSGALLEMVGMSQWKSTKVKKFSKGMLQRLGLAQALVNNPDILFLDEPTDGVDPLGRKEIRDILKELKRNGKTIFLNSHLLSEVELVSDRVAILNKGKLLKVGTVAELTTEGLRYTLTVDGQIPDAFFDEARALVLDFVRDGNSLTANCRSIGELNRIIDLLRKHKANISSVSRLRNTLEDSFLTLIKQEKVT